MRLYSDLAEWWDVFSPPVHYVEEAEHLLTLLEPAAGSRQTLLELGSGGGSLASHLAAYYDLTLTDVSPAMLAVSRRVNPAAEHIQGDLRTLVLGRQFDRVLLHDAVMYMITEQDLLAALTTARRHCRPDGRVVVAPDFVTETFAPATESGGDDAPDGRGLRYVEWSWDPDPNDTHAEVVFAFILRAANGTVRIDSDQQRFGIFPRATWQRLFGRAGLRGDVIIDPWNRDVFVGYPDADAARA
jgi:SAM-dependent methyltransferase